MYNVDGEEKLAHLRKMIAESGAANINLDWV